MHSADAPTFSILRLQSTVSEVCGTGEIVLFHERHAFVSYTR